MTHGVDQQFTSSELSPCVFQHLLQQKGVTRSQKTQFVLTHFDTVSMASKCGGLQQNVSLAECCGSRSVT
ncbi:hypothetical protein NQZ68_022494 [Dissostichus eleginoides]|nr:hypothetical protein NQZ68_040830 [Dissostichus eleginoides]KAI9523862.1 hypothetical protein NQZ68_022494 [Dissostichus eleginoides]